MEKNTSLQEKKPVIQENASIRFTEKILSEFKDNVGEIRITDYQRSLIQGYFIGIDRMLQTQEINRIKKNENNKDHDYDNNLPYIWQNVNLVSLAIDVAHYAKIGLDMLEKNHLSPIPFKNNKTGLYEITLMKGYSGIEYIANKYALVPPVDVTIELVYSNDKFKPLKKNYKNKIESYEFEIENPFDRGELKGGFGYIEYENAEKNKLILMSKADIEKRKPKKASAEFWGGKSKVWEKGKQVETEIEGWYDEMCWKTVVREVFSGRHILRDPKKIDDNYQHMKAAEERYLELQMQVEIEENSNQIFVDIEPVPDSPLSPPEDHAKIVNPKNKGADEPAGGEVGEAKF
ncbi:MAG: recombinase RecT [Oscillospiraceae bacterium]|jgi:recombination protein RecT|nr:recombinase RecT [Oscillospiraceae bacterium]